MADPGALRHVYEILVANRGRQILVTTSLAFLIASWLWFRGRRIRNLASRLTFQPRGLREPVHEIARGNGSSQDLRKIDALLTTYHGEIDSILLEFGNRRTTLRRQLGDLGADELEHQLFFCKKDIRNDLMKLSRREDAMDRTTQKIAVEIEGQMREFNQAVGRILEEHYPGFVKLLRAQLKRLKVTEG